MARKKQQTRNEAQEERDRREISRLYLKGMYQADIAEKLGLSQPTVSRDIKLLIEEWKVERVYDINEAKARELAKVDNLELEYWDAWRRSQENAEKETKKAVQDAKGKPRQEVQKVTEGQVGDPRFLTGVQWCIERRCLILGVDAPKKTDLTSGGKSLTPETMKPSEIAERVAAILKEKNANSS
jgi:predicted transcriptional regulator